MNLRFELSWIGGTLLIVFAVVGGWHAFAFDPGRASSPDHLTVRSRSGRLMHTYLTRRQQLTIPVSIDRIHSNVLEALLAVEDHRFYNHPGVDPVAVARAVWQNLRAGEIRSGASTIPMQLARMADPAPRTFLNKLMETGRALWLDTTLPKRELLERYANRLPFGGNLRGIEVAARVYFGRSAENLTVAQAALLAGIPKNPNRFHPLRHPNRARARRDFVLRRMMEEELIAESRYRSARAHPPAVRRHRLPFEAPHVSEHLRGQGATGSIRTTIDLSVQKRVESLARTHMSSLRPRGVHNLSVLVLDNRTGGVLAYLGSQDFFDDRHGGQIQGPFAVRSPGSTLKPFLYLQAFEDGRLTPAMSLPDVPVHYVGMEPENYDRQFEGIVPARRALKESLNVPAVRLLNRTGLNRFHSTLRNLGFAHLKRDSRYYGLGLVLGGCGVTLWNLTAAYSTLARGGTYLEPTFRYHRARNRLPGRRLFSRESTFLINHILRGRNRPHGDGAFAYKTGTSSEHRDAWTIAYTPEFTVGVWTGNFSNESARVLLGRRTALPLARQILRTLHAGRNPASFEKPPGVVRRRVCSVSGRLATRLCPHTSEGLWIRGRTLNQRCPVHRQITVSPDGSRRYCSGCVRGHDHEVRVVETFPPLVQQFFRRRGMNRHNIPPHNPQCPYHRTNRFDLQIVQPVDGASFVDRKGTRLPIRVAGRDGNRDVFVFVNDRYLGELSTDGTLFYEPEPGRHEVVAVDRTGRAVTHQFRVRTSAASDVGR